MCNAGLSEDMTAIRAACGGMPCWGESGAQDEMVRRAIARRREWAMVGDRQKDVDAARANGIPVIGAGFGYVEDAGRALFDRVVDSPAEQVRWIKAQNLPASDRLL